MDSCEKRIRFHKNATLGRQGFTYESEDSDDISAPFGSFAFKMF